MRTLLILSVFVLQINLFSQDDPIKWKEISMDELKMKEYAEDTSACAIILCDYGQRYFDTNPNGRNLFLFVDRYIRIKILKPEGIKYAHIRIPYTDMDCEDFPDELSITIKGMTYNIDKNGKAIASRLKQKSIKRIDSTECIRIAEFILPDVKPGSVIDYKITIPTLDLIMPQSWYFQNELPTLHSEIRMKVPTQFSYLISPQNFTNFDIYEETDFNQSIPIPSIFYRYYSNRSLAPPFLNISGKQIRLAKFNTEKIENQGLVINPKNYLQHMKIHLTRATKEFSVAYWEFLSRALVITTTEDYDLYHPRQRKSIMYPAGYIYYKLPDWEKLTLKLLKSDKFGLALIKHWNYEEILKEIIKDKDSQEQKLIAIYDFIRKNMNWNGQYTVNVDPVFNNSLSKLYTRITKKLSNEKSLRKPLEDGVGTSSEINFILIYLLNKAGIETHPVLLSTRENGLIDTLIPDAKQFNHVIALSNIGEKLVLLDAIDSLRPYNLLAKNDLISQAYLVKTINFGWLETKNAQISTSIINEKIEIDKDSRINSVVKVKETGYFALDSRKNILLQGKESFNNYLKTKYDLSDQTHNISIQNVEIDSVPVEYTISKSVKTESLNQFEIKPHFTTEYGNEQFNDIVRKYPVDFDFPFKKIYSLEINLPEGYQAMLPENKSFQTYGNNAFYEYIATQTDNKIQIYISMEIKMPNFPVYEYENLKQLFTEINDKIIEAIKIRKLEN